mmetsp:Transcript_42029/g.48725  ORF Transcript_42029/g.48725 Transcript_42029/m.48725 type:complete len:256 (-) Transcript_42029:443-1210(-)
MSSVNSTAAALLFRDQILELIYFVLTNKIEITVFTKPFCIITTACNKSFWSVKIDYRDLCHTFVFLILRSFGDADGKHVRLHLIFVCQIPRHENSRLGPAVVDVDLLEVGVRDANFNQAVDVPAGDIHGGNGDLIAFPETRVQQQRVLAVWTELEQFHIQELVCPIEPVLHRRRLRVVDVKVKRVENVALHGDGRQEILAVVPAHDPIERVFGLVLFIIGGVILVRHDVVGDGEAWVTNAHFKLPKGFQREGIDT